MYLFANDGENHTNNVKQLENMKKAMEENFQPPRLGPRGDAEDPWSADLSRTGIIIAPKKIQESSIWKESRQIQ